MYSYDLDKAKALLAQAGMANGFETTLAGRGYVPLISRLRSEGYRVNLFSCAIAEHWRAGRPVYIWKDGQVVALYPDGITVPASQETEEPGS